MAISKVERLVNLVIALLSTRGFITAEKIRSTVAGYSDSPTVEAFSRMFERDKNELRDLGIPLEVGRVSPLDPTEGYRINRDAYSLPPVELTPDEAAAVAVATQLWESPELITATQGALLKLRAAGVDVDPLETGAPVAIASQAGVPGLRGSDNVLGILLSAIDSGRAVQFEHRSSRAEPFSTRTVEPWGVVTEKGRWYLVGHDRDRDDTRIFRLSRIGAEVTPIGPAGAVTVPADANLRAIVAQKVAQKVAEVTETPASGQAHVWIADGRATALRRAGRSLGPPATRRLGGRDGEVIELDIGSADRLARDIAGYGADAIVLEPQTLREDVLARLRAHAGGGRQ
jgi:proteasome accessory factor B